MPYFTNTDSRYQQAPRRINLKIFNEFENNKFDVRVYPWTTVAELKQKFERDLGILVAQQRLFLRTQELTRSNMTLLSYGIKNKSGLILRAPPMLKNTIGTIKQYETMPRNSVIKDLLFEVQEGFNLGLVPKLTLEGTSGSYLLRGPNRRPAGIFKPIDEEPFTPNNPKGYNGKLGSQGFRKGVVSGESAAREAAAYLVDSTGFLGVPATTFVEIVHPYFGNRELSEDDIEANFKDMIPANLTVKHSLIKHGSIQSFIENAEEASDYSYSQFPEDEVRRIAILDILMLNCDRNEGNILVKRQSNKRLKLIPIDHGLCLPDAIDICTYEVVWTDWPQIHKPFTETELAFINTLKPKEDAQKLAKHLKIRDICLRNFRIASTILIKCAKNGMTLVDIAGLLYKDDPDLLSPIEELIKKTQAITTTMKNSISREFLQNLALTKRARKLSSCKLMQAISKASPTSHTITPEMSDLELIESFGLGELTLGGRSHSDNPISRYTMNMKASEDEQLGDEQLDLQQLEQIFLLKSHSKWDQPSTNDSISEEENETDEELSISKALNAKNELIVRRNASEPDLNKLQTGKAEQAENGQKDGKDEELKQNTLTQQNANDSKSKMISKSLDNEVPLYLDELFFYYFEEFLDHKIETINKNKIKRRGRFMSFDNL